MLDEEDGQAELFSHPTNHLHQLLCLLRIHTRRRLIEEEELRLCGEGTCDLKAALCAVGEVLCLFLRQMLQMKDTQQTMRFLLQMLFLRPVAADAQDGFGEAIVHVCVKGNFDIVAHGQFAKEPDVLKRACNAACSDLIWT